MPDMFTVAVVGNGDEALIAAEGVRKAGAEPILFVSDEHNLVPFSLIRGSWIGKELAIPLMTGHLDVDPEDTTDSWGSLFKKEFSETGAYVYSEMLIQSLTVASLMLDSEQVGAVILAAPLPLVCSHGNEHSFSSIPYWETITKIPTKAQDARFIENDDFKNYPWCVMISILDIIVKIYPSPPPISGAYQVLLPVETNCDCIEKYRNDRPVFAVGPSANWNGKMHRNQIFDQTVNLIEPLINKPKLF